MKFNLKDIYLTLLLALLVCISAFSQNKKFTVILDAGHGGKDPGAKYHGNMEKHSTLDVTLKVGKILEQNPNINIIYTRKTDVFIELTERAKIANRNNADLFVSIHCNANNNTAAYGSETFVMGMGRSNMNLEVSKAENSVIFLEDNYKQTYKGFDPNNPETLIGLKMVQENNLTNSIALATKVQNNFISSDIKSRGVKQEPLWVLDASVMPGVLIEIGFISNKSEADRLTSKDGQELTATAIAKAILDYKKEFFGDSSTDKPIEFQPKKDSKVIEKVTEKVIEPKKEEVIIEEKPSTVIDSKPTSDGIIYKVQIAASSNRLTLQPRNFKGLKEVERSFINGLYKYTYGSSSSYDDILKLKDEAKNAGYTSAFVIAFKNGESISLTEVNK